MPMPQRRGGETYQGFVKRCMDDPAMSAEYPLDQRYAICMKQYFSGGVEGASVLDIPAEEQYGELSVCDGCPFRDAAFRDVDDPEDDDNNDDDDGDDPQDLGDKMLPV